MKWLVVGSRGFVGRSCSEYFRSLGHEVHDCDVRAMTAGEGFKSCLVAKLNEIKPDCLFHAAGSASVGASWNEVDRDFRASVVLWQETLEAVRESGGRPAVFFPSSAAVYGSPKCLPVAEDHEKRPISPYGYHKLLCEGLAAEYANLFGLDITVCRIFSLYGPGQRRLLLWELYEQLISDSPSLKLQGTGEETRDYLHVDDFAEALRLLAGAKRARGLHIYNFGSGESLSVKDVIRHMFECLETSRPVVAAEASRRGDPVSWQADTGLLKRELPAWRRREFIDGLSGCLAAWADRKNHMA